MPLDPNNPSVPVDTSLENWRTQTAEAAQKQADAVKNWVDSISGSSENPATEGGIYLRVLCAVLEGRLADSSESAQIWATDLTKDYLMKYNVNGTPKTTPET